MTQWTPKLEQNIHEYANAFDKHLKDVFNAKSTPAALQVMERDDARLFELHGKVLDGMGLTRTPQDNSSYMPQMQALAAENNCEAAMTLTKLVDLKKSVVKELAKDPGDHSFSHALTVIRKNLKY